MEHIYREIRRDPRFHELERKRGRLSWTLAAFVVVNVLWYIFATAFYPEAGFARLWGQPIAAGMTTTWGIVIGLVQTVGFVALVAYYIHRANGEFDALKDAIVADATRAAGKAP
jgi:cation/acetate symporter